MQQQIVTSQTLDTKFQIILSIFNRDPLALALGDGSSSAAPSPHPLTREIKELTLDLIRNDLFDFIKFNFGFILSKLSVLSQDAVLMKFVLNDVFPNIIISSVLSLHNKQDHSSSSNVMDKETAFNVVAACLEGVAVLFDIYTIDCVLFLANSYGAILRVLVDWPGPAATRNQPNKYWLLLSVLKQRIDQGFDVGNEGLRQACIYFLSQMVICQSGDQQNTPNNSDPDPDDDPTAYYQSFSLSLVPSHHPYLRKDQLKVEATAVLNRFLLFLSQAEEKPCTPSFLCAVLNATFAIIKRRSEYAVPCTQLLVELRAKKLAYLSEFGLRSVYRSLKVVLLSCYSLPSTSTLDDAIEQVLLGFAVQPRELQAKQKLKRLGRQKAAAAQARAVKPPSVPISTTLPPVSSKDEPALAFEILSRGVASFPLALLIDTILSTLASRDEMALQSDLHRFISCGGVYDPEYRATGRQVDIGMEEAGAMQEDQTVPDAAVEEDDDQEVEVDVSTILATATTISPSERPEALSATLDRILSMDSHLESRLLVKNITGGRNGGLSRDATVSARLGWMILIARLLRRGLLPSLDAQDMGTQQHEPGRVVLAFCMAEFHRRVDILILWLFEEFMSDIRKDGSASGNRGYVYWMRQLLHAMKGDDTMDVDGDGGDGGKPRMKGLDVRDKIFTRVLIELPMLNQDALEFVKSYCLEKKRMPLGVTTLRDLITYRPAVRDTCLRWLLEFSGHTDASLRAHACTGLKRFVGHDSIWPVIESHATTSLISLFVKQEEGQVKKEDATSPSGSDQQAIKNELILSKMELFLSLCTAPPFTLLPHLFTHVASGMPAHVLSVLSLASQTLFTHALQPDTLLPLITSFPAGSEELVLVLISCLLQKGGDVTTAVVEKTLQVFVERDLSVRFLQTIITYLDKENVLKHIGKIVEALDGTPESVEMVKSIFTSLVQVRGEEWGNTSIVSPADLLVRLHNLSGIKLKKALAATDICFAMPDLFKQEVLALVLSTLTDQPGHLPRLFMRSVLESLKAHPPLSSYINALLLRLVTKQIWKDAKLWEGYVKAVVKTFPSSLPILLALPKQWALSVLRQSRELCGDLDAYLQQLPTHQQKRREVGVLVTLVAEAGRSFDA